MKKTVILHLKVPGIHNWIKAEEVIGKEVSFLKHPHRHIFVIEMGISVKDSDREVEIFCKELEVKKYLYNKYSNEYETLAFGGMSCEMIAEELLTEFNANWVEVREDGFGGARVEI